jgi:hypothetical protein
LQQESFSITFLAQQLFFTVAKESIVRTEKEATLPPQ